MKLKSYLRQAAVGALCLLICAAGLCQSAFAVEVPANAPAIDTTKSCTLTLRYLHDGVTVRLYKVGEVTGNGRFSAIGDFKGLGVDLNSCETASDWKALASNLWAKAPNGAAAVASGTTSGGGVVTFSKDRNNRNLTVGLYLVVTDRYTRTEWDATGTVKTREVIYTVAPYVVSLPTWNTASSAADKWNYNINSAVGEKAAQSDQTTVGYMAIKIWHNSSGQRISWPAGQTVTLVLQRSQNGRWVDVPGSTRVLSSGSTYCWWEDLDNHYTYRVREVNVPYGYTSSVQLSDSNAYTFEVVNTYTPTYPDDPSPSEPVYPRPSQPVNPRPSQPVNPRPSQPVNPRPSDVELEDPNVPRGDVSSPPNRTNPPEEIELDDPDVPLGDLPQTGQLWWPVPALAVAGVFLLLIGFVRHRNGEYDDE